MRMESCIPPVIRVGLRASWWSLVSWWFPDFAVVTECLSGEGLQRTGLRCAGAAVGAPGFQALANALISRANIIQIVEVRRPERAL